MKDGHIVALLISGVLMGCSVSPDYVVPETTLPRDFTAGSGSPLVEPAVQRWWQDLRDPALNALVADGLANNLDIATTLTRIAAAEARLRGTGLNAQISGEIVGTATRSGLEGLEPKPSEAITGSASYIFDMFGAARLGQERALADLQAVGFSLGDALATNVLSIVNSYTAARFSQEAAELTRLSISSRRETLSLVQRNRSAGVASDLDVVQAEVELLTAQSDLEGHLADFEEKVFALATLTLRDPARLMMSMQSGAPQPTAPHAGNLGTPADLLRNLPSVRSAERTYAAQVAALGVQEASLYPALTIGGSVTMSSIDSWSFGPRLLVPVLNRGALRAGRDAQIAAVEEARLQWEATVRDAVEKVEVNSNRLQRSQRQITLLERVVVAGNRILQLSRANFEAGTTSLLELLDAERAALAQRISLASQKRVAANDWSALQVALGRGWNVE